MQSKPVYEAQNRAWGRHSALATKLGCMSEPTTLAEVLASLPQEERIILTMHYLKSMSCLEIAAILSVPVRSVDAVISSGKARLTAVLGD